MLSYLLKTTLCWALFYLLYHLWLSKETFFNVNRWYLVWTAFLGVLIPAIDFQWFLLPHEEPAILYYMQPITVGVEQLETVIVMASTEEAGINWWGILIKIYWLGVAVAFGRFIYGLSKINKLYKEGEKTFFNNYRFILTSSFHVPFSFFKNLFWSKEFVVDEEDKQNILRHEEAHIFQWHSIDVILLEILGILFWCVPFIYLYKKAIKTTHEYLADDYVVALASRKKYGQLLLRQSQSGMQIAVSNSLFSSQIKNRIVMMTKNRSTKMASLKYLAGLPLLALLFLAFSFEQKTPDPQERTHPVLKNHTATDSLPGDEVFKVVEIMPHFPGCEEMNFELEAEAKKCADKKMLEFIYANIKYPKEAREGNIQGMVVIKFIVEKDGSISNVKLLRDIGGGCGEEALRVANAMPRWTPGLQRGRAVRVQFNLPVKFKLDSDAPDSKITDKKITDKMPLIIGRSAEILSTEDTSDPHDTGKMSEAKSFTDVFKVVEDMPRFPGCEEITDAEQRKICSQKKLLEFIYTNIKYPKHAREKGIEGTSFVKFIVEKDGSIADAETLRPIGGECDDEVLKVVYMMPNWIPGKQGGEAVRTQYLLPVRFKLDPSDANAKIDDPDEMPILASCANLKGDARTKCSNEELISTVYSKIKYPKEAKEKKVEGTVIVKFTVNINGDVVNPRATHSLAYGCTQEVFRVIRELPKWIPGKKDGKPVAVEMTLPVKFRLNGEDKIISMNTDAKINESPVAVKAFPNPATDKLSLEIKLDEGSYKLTMTDVNGKIIHSKKIEGSGGRTLNISDFPVKDVPRGTLYVTITDAKGKVVESATVVLQ